ncbi:putative isoamyl alcohol oxidase [Aspergillus lucknowensis]|uniref:FAD-binding PCMH-type domain-containing protein n=1 Tax=Aspergillus lucknowensis TaxID=176173 RepID=A0ABR4LD79_9EURO
MEEQDRSSSPWFQRSHISTMKAIWAVAGALFIARATAASSSECHCLPGDDCWPAPSEWDALNCTVGGRLIATVPVGSPCHDPNYDVAACAELQTAWTFPQTHCASSSSVMHQFFANRSCDPFTPRDTPCELGNYVSYAVDVASGDDVIAAIKFAQQNNIRFVIRNTGHDYLGRSTGAGALSVWTHHLDSIEYLNWTDPTYSGPAYKLGSGVQGYQVLEATHARGHVLVGGECPTVGLAGGYTQGGGHSALSTNFGLGADQTLAFEVVTAAGKVVTASRTSNTDLYWALSGGGAGNYGVVLSATVKAYPNAVVSGASVAFSTRNLTSDVFVEAVTRFHELLPAMIDAGTTVIYQILPGTFLIHPLTAYNQTSEQVKTILAPLLSALTDLGVPHTATYTQYDSYYDHYADYMGPLPNGNLGVGEFNYGGRLLPRAALESNSAGIATVLHNLTAQGVVAVGVGLNVSRTNDVPNAIFDPWRNAAVTLQIGSAWSNTAPWSKMLADQKHMTDSLVPQLEAVSPGSGAYENEADFRQANWKETFFGSNYNALARVKAKWDPHHFFYALKGVGSDFWTVSESGRMCKAESGRVCKA